MILMRIVARNDELLNVGAVEYEGCCPGGMADDDSDWEV